MTRPFLTPERRAALHAAAKRRAHELRRQAIADVVSRVIGAVSSTVHHLVATMKKGAPRGTPFASERRTAA